MMTTEKTICDLCRYNKEECDGDHCCKCDQYEHNMYMPDWVTLISVYFGLSRNQAKRVYHDMLENYRISKHIKKLENERRK